MEKPGPWPTYSQSKLTIPNQSEVPVNKLIMTKQPKLVLKHLVEKDNNET